MFPIKVCRNCVNSGINEWKAGEIKGYFVTFTPKDNICPYCQDKLYDTNLSYDEYKVIISVSQDVIFIEAMIKLKQDDIIEYQSRMSQFRSQIQQQKKEEESNTLKCPYCHSADIAKIGGMERAASVTMFGIFSKKINKSFKCKKCGGTF